MKNRAVGGRSVNTWLYEVQTVMDPTGECALTRDVNGAPLVHASLAGTNEAWKGWPLRLAQYSEQRGVTAFVTGADTLVVWNGGVSEVTLRTPQVRQDDGLAARAAVVRHQLVRYSGMADFLPQGTAFDEIRWHGAPSGCVLVEFEPGRVERFSGYPSSEFNADRGLRMGITDAHIVDRSGLPGDPGKGEQVVIRGRG